MDERQSGSEDDAAIRNVIESWTAARASQGFRRDSPKPFFRPRDVRCSATVSIQGNRSLQEDVGLVLFLVQAIRSPSILLK